MPPDEPAVQFDYAAHEARVMANMLRTAGTDSDNLTYAQYLSRWYRDVQGGYFTPLTAQPAAGDIIFIDPLQALSVADNPLSAGTSPLPSAENSPEPLALWVHERSGRCAYCDVGDTTRTYVKPKEEDMRTWKWCHPECQAVAAQTPIKSK